MEVTKKYINEHSEIQEVISTLLNKSKLLGLNRYGKWGPVTNLVAILKIICIGDVEKDGILLVGIQLIRKADLHVFLKSYITKEKLKELKYRICIVNKYKYTNEKQNKIQLEGFYFITDPKIIEEQDKSIDINIKLLNVTCWRDAGDETLILTNYSSELNRLFGMTDNSSEIDIDKKKILTPIVN